LQKGQDGHSPKGSGRTYYQAMKILLAFPLVAIALIGTQAVGQTREGALCSGLVAKARQGKALTDDQKAYLQNWCAIKNPYMWDARNQSRTVDQH
jgi:hypothetical protein